MRAIISRKRRVTLGGGSEVALLGKEADPLGQEHPASKSASGTPLISNKVQLARSIYITPGTQTRAIASTEAVGLVVVRIHTRPVLRDLNLVASGVMEMPHDTPF